MEEQKASAEGMAGEHTLVMTKCSELSLTGVREVRSFDENEVKMDTSWRNPADSRRGSACEVFGAGEG